MITRSEGARAVQPARAPSPAADAVSSARLALQPDLAGLAATVLLAACIFLWDPFGLDRWVFAKELVLVAAALMGVFAEPVGRTATWWRWWLVSGFLILLTGAAASAAPVAQALGRWPRYEGAVTLAIYALAVVAGARLLGGPPDDWRVRRRSGVFGTTLAIGLAVSAFFAVAEGFGARPIPSDLDRPGSVFGNASDLGIAGVLGLAIFLRHAGIARSPFKPFVGILGLASAVVVVALSASRAALLGAIVVLVIEMLIRFRSHARTWKAWASPALVVTAGAAIILLLPAVRGRLDGTEPNAVGSAANRLTLWADTLGLVAARPTTGAGASGFADAVTQHLGSEWFAATGVGAWIESPHNLLLQVLTAGGVLAGLAVGALVWLATRNALRAGVRGPFGTGGIVALVGAGTALLFHFTSPGPMILACTVFGATLVSQPPKRPAGRARTLVAIIGLSLWLASLGAAIAADHALRSGIQELSNGSVDLADRSFTTAAMLRPWDADVPLIVSEQYAAVAEHAGSSAVVPMASLWAGRAVARLPASTRALKAQAVIAQYAGDTAQAIHALTQAAGLSPTDPQVFHRLGGMLLMGGQTQSAITVLTRAASLAPADPGIRETLEYARKLD